MKATSENGDKFCIQRRKLGITFQDLDEHIKHHVTKLCPNSESQRQTAFANIRKELRRVSMTDKVLAKGLAIIGLNDDEIKAVMAA